VPDKLRFAMVAVVAAVSAMSSAEAVVRLAGHRPVALRAASAEVSFTGPGAAIPAQGGQVMKASGGKANPKVVSDLLRRRIGG